MKALVYPGPGNRSYDEEPIPVIMESTDAIVKTGKTNVCGTDLRIMNGDVPSVLDGCFPGHEGVGIVEKVGSGVSNFSVGDQVLISCIHSCGECENCKKGKYSHCENGEGGILGNLIDGTQAEFVRIPFADNGLSSPPPVTDGETFVMLSDILPTGFECGVLNGEVKPGDTVAIFGAGPIGLAILVAAQFYSPAQVIVVDNDDNRLKVAKYFGATRVINNGPGNAAEKILSLTKNRGVDVAIEAVGIPESFDVCQEIVTAGGHITNVGIHGKPVHLNLDKLWSKNITLTAQLADTLTTPLFLEIVSSGRLHTKHSPNHHFMLDQVMQAYDYFGNAT
jgi:alcohol dehydrogenase